ncbi:acyltransferase family protein [Hymenobacter volaticus]|uniref:Acyltransferase n=1 Tax=Hymenobacter volaticus TaxID=2932254 RepID=A0ABY4G6C4_9BACT|nr:acyltransferase [Hymenobacter volaticus]UOQ66460.1 acyltransferase [Hymenobacter volaticus]
MQSSSQQPKIYFPNLDGLRTLACLGVFAFHGLVATAPGESASFPAFSVFNKGTLGVNFFYVLSGFLITYLLLDEEQRHQRINLLDFYRRRILRIWPVFYMVIVYGFFVHPLVMHLFHMSHHENASLGLHMVFLGNMDSVWKGVQPAAGSLAVLWSVAVEEQFYLVWPILLMFLFRRWRPGAFLLIMAASFWFRFTHQANFFLTYRHTFAVMSDMAMGGGAGWLCFRYPAFRQFIAGWSRWTITGIYVLGLLTLGPQKFLPSAVKAVTDQHITQSFFFVLVILEQNYATRSWFKIKNIPFLTYWGTFTYGFYCLHSIVLELLALSSHQLHIPSTPLNTVIRVAIALPLSAGLAWLSYTYFEKYFLLLKNKRKPATEQAGKAMKQVITPSGQLMQLDLGSPSA